MRVSAGMYAIGAQGTIHQLRRGDGDSEERAQIPRGTRHPFRQALRSQQGRTPVGRRIHPVQETNRRHVRHSNH